jgi:adenosylhomocysteine nucleosidase
MPSAEKSAGEIVVCFAMEDEARPFRNAGPLDHRQILVTGIGRENTALSIYDFLKHHRRATVLTCGFAGGLNPALNCGDVVFETPDDTLRKKLMASGAKPAKFFCADRIAVSAAEKQRLRAETGADAVEMESQVVHAACRQREIPCATLRVISDTATEDLPLDFNLLSDAKQNLSYLKLAWAIARAPRKIPALIQFGKRTKSAAEKLAVVLERVIAAT